MKDQFANYVVQKMLETCSDQQRELILSRIKVHLNALKKYTYGKHIVARVEKLVAAGGMLFHLLYFPCLRNKTSSFLSTELVSGITLTHLSLIIVLFACCFVSSFCYRACFSNTLSCYATL